jgi:hypothetical protein
MGRGGGLEDWKTGASVVRATKSKVLTFSEEKAVQRKK